jgi:predicted acetyltransferase
VEIAIRPCKDAEDLRRALVIWQYVGAEPTLDDVQLLSRVLPFERAYGAWDGGDCVGGAAAFPFHIALPGGRSVASAGVTMIGVAPTHRRRGVLTRLMRVQLDELRARGEAIAWLWASEAPIYGRFGYGLASMAYEIDVPRERTAYALDRPLVGRARRLSHEDALELLPPLYDAACRQHTGMPSRTRAWWDVRRFNDAPHRRAGGGLLNRVVLEEDGVPIGYALYRVRQQMAHGVTEGALLVVEAMGVTPEATRSIWRMLLDFDWVSRIEANNLPADHVLPLLVAEPRRLQWRASDGVWIRLVALATREWSSDEPVVFEVDDVFCPWNTGRWRLAGGAATRTDAPADLRLDVDVLGAAYLGAFSFRRLWEAGRVEELRPGALAAADRVFAADTALWCPEIF